MRILFFAIVVVLLFPQIASSEQSAETNSETYLRAKSVLEEDPETAFKIGQSLKPFSHADDVRLNLLADAALRTQRVDQSIKFLAQYEKKTENKKEKFRSNLERAELYALIGQSKKSKSIAKKLTAMVRRLRMGRAERRFFQSRVLRLLHDLETESPKAQKRYAKQLLISFPTEPATKRGGLNIELEKLSDAERFRRANVLMDTWAYHEARSEFERLEKIKKYAMTSSWNLGVIGLRKLRDRPEEAERRFKKLSKSGKYKEGATWYWARALMKQNKYKEVFKVYDIYEKNFPRGKNIADIYYYRGWLPYDARENKKAIVGLKKYIKRFGKRSRKSSYVYGFLAWTYMREKQWKNAIKAWNDMLGFGNTLVAGKALYWRAVAQNELKEKDNTFATLDTLRSKYPLSYYGMLGEQLRARLEGKSDQASKVWWPERKEPIDDAPQIDIKNARLKLSKPNAETWKRVLQLAELDEKHLARESFKSIKEPVLAAAPKGKRKKFIHALGWHIEDFNTMWTVSAGSIRAMAKFPVSDPLKMVMAYPRAYEKVVSSVADEFDVPAVFIWSIMRQESRYKPSAISYTDAVGALQMIPKTARLVAADIGTSYNLRTFFRPEVGFRFSGFYMKRILDYFDGLFVPAAASYNTGPKVISRWFHKNKDLPFDHLIEEFEYNEGRAYCRKVTEHMLRYVYLYVEDEQQRAEMVDKMFPQSRDVEVPLPAEIPY